MAKKNRRRITIQINEKLEQRLETACKRHAKSLGAMVRYCLVAQLPFVEQAKDLPEVF